MVTSMDCFRQYFVNMCIPWELNPQPFALLTQCSTIEPREHYTEYGRSLQIQFLHYYLLQKREQKIQYCIPMTFQNKKKQKDLSNCRNESLQSVRRVH